ncbi:MAG TPA: outer membrane protein assembly factor BamD [Candidatus Hydrogenedentes bacterium]|nr:outer membrane protein assembly factor BamD [Candidatus Hydrogenedentota bacterium]HOL76486.1 outer membrane protein assembly factor BamD [Candidatus Hydrogenedentota bacterium]HPO85150.1 outer membrane protein assembly factor BamD [Candidatus Hydrogenedentota bacterium]
MQRCRFAAAFLVAIFLGIQVAAVAQWTWTPQTKRWINLKRLPKETPELQVEYARSLMLQGEYKKALRETNKFKSFYGDTAFADENQFLRGEIRMAQGDYKDAAKEFQQVITGYPDTDRFQDVIKKQYEIGDLLFEKGQKRLKRGWWIPFRKRPFSAAIEVYRMVIDNQPFTEAAAEAQYKVGLCHFTLKEYVEAAYEYRRVVEEYGNSEWVDEAAYGLAECYYAASRPPEYDQSPSLLAITAIDDFKRRFPSDERLQTLEPKRTEMRERVAQQRLKTAQFYEKRRKFDAARICYEVVVEQFPETTAAEKAKTWLTEHPKPVSGDTTAQASL